MKVNGTAFGRLIFDYYGIELSEEEKEWFSFDGKELKGSILSGDKRGEAIALAVRHEDRAVSEIAFFNGSKESEVAAVRSMLKEPLVSQKLTMDALHFKPLTLEPIHVAGGIYLVGLKKNQKELLSEMKFCVEQLKPCFEDNSEWEKGHGRWEQRSYFCYDIEGAYIDERWTKVGFKTLIKVERQRIVSKNPETENKNVQIAYFLSNMDVQKEQDALELFHAVRKHWQVETANYIRDCILAEDKLRCIDSRTNRTIALCRTLAIKLLDKSDIKNKAEQMDYFADDFRLCLNFLKSINFL